MKAMPMRRWSDRDETVPSDHARKQARQEVSERVNASEVENGDTVEQAVREKRPRGLLLVIASLVTALLVGGAFFLRAYSTETQDTALCEKIDRLIVAIEKRTQANPDTTQAEKQAAIKFYENFRNDPPVCRTSPAPPTTTGKE